MWISPCGKSKNTTAATASPFPNNSAGVRHIGPTQSEAHCPIRLPARPPATQPPSQPPTFPETSISSGTDLMVGKVWYERHLLVTSMLRGRPVPMRKPRGGTIYGGQEGR